MHIKNFNPRPREGSDRSTQHKPFDRLYFNPRPREGSDRFAEPVGKLLLISIHAPARGATMQGR